MPTESPAAVAMIEKIFIVVARPCVVVHSKAMLCSVGAALAQHSATDRSLGVTHPATLRPDTVDGTLLTHMYV